MTFTPRDLVGMEALVLLKSRGLLQPGSGRGSGTGVWTVSPDPAGGVGLGPEGEPRVSGHPVRAQLALSLHRGEIRSPSSHLVLE